MKTNSVSAAQLLGFICDEMRRDELQSVRDNARTLQGGCDNVIFIPEEGDCGSVLTIWMKHRECYARISEHIPTMRDIENTAKTYVEHVLGFTRGVMVQVLCRRESAPST
jgi:hypothetical protein